MLAFLYPHKPRRRNRNESGRRRSEKRRSFFFLIPFPSARSQSSLEHLFRPFGHQKKNKTSHAQSRRTTDSLRWERCSFVFFFLSNSRNWKSYLVFIGALNEFYVVLPGFVRSRPIGKDPPPPHSSIRTDRQKKRTASWGQEWKKKRETRHRKEDHLSGQLRSLSHRFLFFFSFEGNRFHFFLVLGFSTLSSLFR